MGAVERRLATALQRARSRSDFLYGKTPHLVKRWVWGLNFLNIRGGHGAIRWLSGNLKSVYIDVLIGLYRASAHALVHGVVVCSVLAPTKGFR